MFTYEKKILFGDCDAAGILFFANLFKYMHEAYEFFIEEFEDYAEHFNNVTRAYPIIKTEAEYFAPLFLGKTAAIKVIVAEVRESSFELNYEFSIDGETKARGKTVHVCVNISSGEKTPLPDKLAENLKLRIAKN
jgi:1,4-dihydroxy-2-naphthoyl-CoA hydrolase